MTSERPPLWLVLATAAMALILLAMSVGETSLKGQYLIDQGEYLSLVGLAFILGAGLYLHRQQRLVASMPLVLPWLLYPVITQGDQIIDNLSINWMRAIVHLLLAAIFATPVAVAVLATRWLLAPAAGAAPRRRSWTVVLPGLRAIEAGRVHEGTTLLSAALLTLEMWLANLFLGTLMVVTLIVLIAAVLFRGSEPAPAADTGSSARRSDLAWWMLVAGVVLSAGLYVGFKNRPGAYQGSPSFYMDPSQPAGGFDLAAVAVPSGPVTAPADAGEARSALSTYAAGLQKLLDGYYVLDRNYNYHFHNELFLRSTPLLANYRAVGLGLVDEGAALSGAAVTAAAAARASLDVSDPLRALLDDVDGYVAFSFNRASTLERMSAEFETTPAGLQHATHIYEGEGKYLGVGLADLLDKHHVVLSSPAASSVVADFGARARAIHAAYANRIVGF